MTPVSVSFYVLSENKAQDILGFVCSLTQTVIDKSELAVVILSEDKTKLAALDDELWDFEATSFIPHQVLDDNANLEPKGFSPRVLLSQTLPNGFSGAVINLMPKALVLNSDNHSQSPSQNSNPSRILELVLPNEQSTALGRQKYQAYKSQGCKLQHFKV